MSEIMTCHQYISWPRVLGFWWLLIFQYWPIFSTRIACYNLLLIVIDIFITLRTCIHIKWCMFSTRYTYCISSRMVQEKDKCGLFFTSVTSGHCMQIHARCLIFYLFAPISSDPFYVRSHLLCQSHRLLLIHFIPPPSGEPSLLRPFHERWHSCPNSLNVGFTHSNSEYTLNVYHVTVYIIHLLRKNH